MAKKVILHIGFHKTGSSALQVFLATNAERLAAAGIGYPYPDPEHIVATGGCSGNAVQVLYRCGFMNEFKVDGDIENRLKKAYFEKLAEVVAAVPQDIALVSSEVLSAAPRENLTHFIELLRPFHDIEIVCFVRDPFDVALSSWLQMIKDGTQKICFSSYVNKMVDGSYLPSMLNSFEFFHGLGLPLAVLNFDHHRHNIAAPFLRAIGAENLIGQVELTTTREANRSLTPSAAHLGVLLHEKLSNGDLIATFLRGAQGLGRKNAVPYYNRDQHRRILDRFSSTVALINEYLSEDQKLATGVRDQPDIDFVVVPEDAALLLELVEKLIQARGAQKVGSMGREGFTTSVVLPSDFDADAYLFHNPDVATAKVDPARHYLEHGWREGRRYRFF